MQEVIVIGGGISGVAAATALWRRGFAVNLVEQEGLWGAASGAAAGMLAPQYESAGDGPLFHLLVSARDDFDSFTTRINALSGGEIRPRPGGMLVANLTIEEDQEAHRRVAWQRAAGQEAAVITPAEALRIEPAVSPDALSYLWLEAEASVDVQSLAEQIPDAVRRTGIRLIRGRVAAVLGTSEAVEGVEMSDGRTLSADQVVLAAGAWDSTVQRPGLRPPVRPVRGHLLRYRTPSAPRIMVAGHGGRYLVPRDDGSLVAGSTMEETAFDRSLLPEAAERIHLQSVRLLPGLRHQRPIERWTGLRPISGDGLPVLGRDPEVENLWFATGYGRNGILLAPLAGQALAAMMAGETVDPDWSAFSPARFSSPAAPSGAGDGV